MFCIHTHTYAFMHYICHEAAAAAECEVWLLRGGRSSVSATEPPSPTPMYALML